MAGNYPQSSHTNKAKKPSSAAKKLREQSSLCHWPVEPRKDPPRPVLDRDASCGFKVSEGMQSDDDIYHSLNSQRMVDHLFEMLPEELGQFITNCQEAITRKMSELKIKSPFDIAEKHALFFACCEVTTIANMHDRIQTLPSDATSRTLVLQRTRAASFLRRNVFRKGKLLGEGTYGAVYLTSTHYSPKLYALKIVKIKLRENATKMDIDNFMQYQVMASRERDAMITADHPFICKLKASWVEKLHVEGLSYMLLMEYAPFGTLKDFIKCVFHRRMPSDVSFLDYNQLIKFIEGSKAVKDNSPSDPSVRKKLIYIYAAEITSAIDFLHHLGIVHRDLKPGNILIGEGYHLRVSDFGFTTSQKAHLSFKLHKVEATNHPALTQNPLEASFDTKERLEGTWAYCRTPEIALRQVVNTKYFYAMDMWSIGVILFELYGGLHPFTALFPWNDNQEELVKREIEKFRNSRLLMEPFYSMIIDDEHYCYLVSLLIMEEEYRLTCCEALTTAADMLKEVVGTGVEELHRYNLDFLVDVIGRTDEGTSADFDGAGWSPYSGVGSPHCEGATALAQTFPSLDSPQMSDQ